MSERQTVTAHISPGLKDQLIELARADDRTLSQYVHRVLQDHVEQVAS